MACVGNSCCGVDGKMNMKSIETTFAVCPFCRKHITVNSTIVKRINADCQKDTLTQIIIGKANYIKCPECKEDFYYEHPCGVFSVSKKYAIVCTSGNDTDILPKEKSALLKILRLEDFKLRCVNEFIQLIEKVRIFESGLDDRVLEIIKHKYITAEENYKIILTNVTPSSMIFTVFDEYDRAKSTHPVNLEVYSKENNLPEELIQGDFIQWNKIDKAYIKHILK